MIKQANRVLDLLGIEKKVQKYWAENNTYEKTNKMREAMPDYYFLDGPPYASGHIHMGTAWNKIIKDAIIRQLSMQGYNVRKQPGWDCHGLPIEVQVEKKEGIKNKNQIIEMGVENFIRKCKDFAYHHVGIMTEQFKGMGIWMDWDKPYMTLKDEYIEAAWYTIKKAEEKKLLTNDLRVVSWCPRCETALAEAELEYANRTDPSVYVKFPVEGRENEFIVIWTTTPWTLIGNLGVMVSPDLDYIKAETDQGVLILARELAPILKDKFALGYEIIEEFKGKELEGLRYKNPLDKLIDITPPENAYQVILADFVSLGEGTGCVHCAPGHGVEDFEAAQPYGIGPVCPVDDSGKFTSDAGQYAGNRTKKDDNKIIADLDEMGSLLKMEDYTHRYGHCWRCKTPIIYRATNQWFIKVSEFKDKMLKEIEKVEWIPDWAGSARFKDWVEHARDWTISRQRYWGIPLPVWTCDDCGNRRVIGSKKELTDMGIEISELHKPFVDDVKLKCQCGGEMVRVPDVLDVWFDSGVAAWATLDYPGKTEDFEKYFPAKFITEGHDQTRGWFYTQLICGMVTFDRSPYEKVLMHGFTLDERGEKMSKSLGNAVNPDDVRAKFGSDILRFYILWASKPWDDLKFSFKEMEVVKRMFNIFWNVYVFGTTYMSIDGFDPEKVDKNIEEHYKLEDRWMISRLNTVIKEVNQAYETKHIYKAPRVINDFILEDLSRWYITLIRPRTWIEKDDPEKLAAYSVLYEVLVKLAKLICPISPHIAEEMYENLVKGIGKGKESIFMEGWDKANEKAIDPELEEDMTVIRGLIDAVTQAREKNQIKRRWPVKSVSFIPVKDEYGKSIEKYKEIVKIQANSLDIKILKEGQELEGKIVKAMPNLSTVGPEFKGHAKGIMDYLSNADGAQIKANIKDGLEIEIYGEKVTLSEKHVLFKESMPLNLAAAEFEYGMVYLDTTKDDEINAQGYAREVIRRIQEMRKEKDMDIEAFISSAVGVPDEEIVGLLTKKKEYISSETRSKMLEISISPEHLGRIKELETEIPEAKGYTKEWNIEGINFKISINSI